MKNMSMPRRRLKLLPSLSLSLYLVSGGLSSVVLAEDDVRHQFPPPEVNRDWIAAALDQEQLIYLQGEQKFFALFAEERWGKPKGAVLIIPDPDEIPWPPHLLELHKELADHGWHSLIISLPIQAQAATAHADATNADSAVAIQSANAEGLNTETSNMQPETSNGVPSDIQKPANPGNYQSAVQQRLNAAIDYLHTKGQFNIAVAASGRSGEYAEKLLEERLVSSQETGVNPLQAVILINAIQNGTTGWLKSLAGLPLPLLDIYYNGELSDQSAAARRSKFKRQRKPIYNQVALPKPLPDSSRLNQRLARRCRGWLDQHIAGMASRSLVKIR